MTTKREVTSPTWDDVDMLREIANEDDRWQWLAEHGIRAFGPPRGTRMRNLADWLAGVMTPPPADRPYLKRWRPPEDK